MPPFFSIPPQNASINQKNFRTLLAGAVNGGGPQPLVGIEFAGYAALTAMALACNSDRDSSKWLPSLGAGNTSAKVDREQYRILDLSASPPGPKALRGLRDAV